MIPLVLIYLALILVFAVAGVGVWVLRGHGFRGYRPPDDEGPVWPGATGEKRGRP